MWLRNDGKIDKQMDQNYFYSRTKITTNSMPHCSAQKRTAARKKKNGAVFFLFSISSPFIQASSSSTVYYDLRHTHNHSKNRL